MSLASSLVSNYNVPEHIKCISLAFPHALAVCPIISPLWRLSPLNHSHMHTTLPLTNYPQQRAVFSDSLKSERYLFTFHYSYYYHNFLLKPFPFRCPPRFNLLLLLAIPIDHFCWRLSSFSVLQCVNYFPRKTWSPISFALLLFGRWVINIAVTGLMIDTTATESINVTTDRHWLGRKALLMDLGGEKRFPADLSFTHDWSWNNWQSELIARSAWSVNNDLRKWNRFCRLVSFN